MRKERLQAEERRKTARYSLQLPVIFKWRDGARHTEGGFTRDMSLKALFVNSTASLPITTHLQLQILLPTSANIGGTPVKSEGRVVRLSSEREGPGFAVTALLYSQNDSAKIRVQ